MNREPHIFYAEKVVRCSTDAGEKYITMETNGMLDLKHFQGKPERFLKELAEFVGTMRVTQDGVFGIFTHPRSVKQQQKNLIFVSNNRGICIVDPFLFSTSIAIN